MSLSSSNPPDGLALGAGDLWSGLRFHAARLATGMPGYGATLGDDDPGPFRNYPSTIDRGEVGRGHAILDGIFPFAGQTVKRSDAVWSPEGVGSEWLTAVHGFHWLHDLIALGGPVAHQRAVALIMDWIDQNREWSAIAWSAPVLGVRIRAWIYSFKALFGDMDDMAQRRVRKSLARQVAHLDRVAAHESSGSARLRGLSGLVLAALCLEPFRRRLPSASRLLCVELDRQILPDGGHVERNPTVLAQILLDLVDLRAAFRSAQLEVPLGVQNAIDRMAPMIRFFRHGDGGFALFNGASEGDRDGLDRLLAASESRAKTPSGARHSGYERMQAGKTLVMADAGGPPPRDLASYGHAGALSFEMSVGKDRLIVNCGSASDSGSDWREAQRSTPAHSTVSLALTNSSALTEDGFGDRLARVTAERKDEAGSCWLDMRHDGFSKPLGFMHQRRLFLDSDGVDLRGEDRLIPVDPRQPVTPRRFEIRFHLHPAVQSSLLANQSAAFLRLPGGDGWRFRSSGAAIRLEDSIYMGRSGDARRSRQLVLTGETRDGERVVKWAVQREGS